MDHPTGTYAPIPTPLGSDGEIDLAAVERHLASLAAGGLDGALIGGTNGEFPSLDLNERLAVAEAGIRGRGGLSMMLGIGSSALPEAVQLVQSAGFLGFDAALLPPPFYFRTAPTSGLVRFFRGVLDESELPVLLYHIPQVTGIPISDAILDGVEDHPRFAGVKDSSARADELFRFTHRLAGRSVMVGTDRLLSLALASGAAGSISASASVAPALVAATARDPRRQPELDAVRGLLERFGLGPAVKALLRHRGIGAYRTRPPLVDLDDAAAAEVVARFEALTGG